MSPSSMAGKPFNISSPQQLGRVLFEDLKLPAPKQAKGKAISTAAGVLDELAAGHEIVRKVLETGNSASSRAPTWTRCRR